MLIPLVLCLQNIVSIGGKAYQVSFDDPPFKACPREDADYAAFRFLHKAAFQSAYTVARSSCAATGQDCDAPEKIAAYKAAGQGAVFALLRDYPPSYRDESCQRARQECKSACRDAGGAPESRCDVDCEQFDPANKL